jgi:hypothetical protein
MVRGAAVRLTSIEASGLVTSWAEYIPRIIRPEHFLTLTARNYVYESILESKYLSLVRATNKELFGNNFDRRGEGISWAMAIEPQRRGVLHVHALWDQSYIPYKFILDYWQGISGFAKILPVDDATGASAYLAKYVVKGGKVHIYLSKQKRAFLEVH